MAESMEALGLTAAQLASRGAGATAREIAQQPLIWPEIVRLVAGDAALRAFLTPLLAEPQLRIVLTGAGSSSFVGECLAPALARSGSRRAEAIATTDIVANPASTLSSRASTLMVHFARSGNSPESVGVLELAEQRIERCAHLIVTCNRDGELYRRAGALRAARALLLPEACNDQGFAMTSSFTGMLLAASAALCVVAANETRITRLARLATQLMSTGVPLVTGLVRAQFERVIYLGSGELKGLAREAALKMLELTDGRVVSAGDAPLGFRHGPKSILNGSALVVLFVSNDPYTRRYELDLLSELRRDGVAGRVIAIANAPGVPEDRDTVMLADAASDPLTDLELCLPYATFAQSLAMLRSLSLWLTPDSPNAAGTVNRVVQGVSIYPYGGVR
ncbi:MAG: SIS domain-containing protein [Steroidobacteraceae bacterium]|jgi:tagatose-6-phosphate ketose/aldose isomerase